MNNREDFMRPYLVVSLFGEDFPMLIKMKSRLNWAPCNTDLQMWFNIDGETVIRVNTGYAKNPTCDIPGLKFDIFNHGDSETTIDIRIDPKAVGSVCVEMLDEGCLYIASSRDYYTRKYGVSYERE